MANRTALQLYKPTPRTETIRVVHDERLMACYALVDELRQLGQTNGALTELVGLAVDRERSLIKTA